MASIRKRPRKDGTATWQILWREDGQQQGHTVDTEAEASKWAERAYSPAFRRRVTDWEPVETGDPE